MLDVFSEQVTDYILDAKRAEDYFRLLYPDWKEKIYLTFLLFLDYKILGGEELLSFYGERRIIGGELIRMALDQKLLPLDLAMRLEGDANRPTGKLRPKGSIFEEGKDWRWDLEKVEADFTHKYQKTRRFSDFFEGC